MSILKSSEPCILSQTSPAWEDDRWRGKPYYSLDAWCRNTYGEKLYKIALHAGLSCPNRDGRIDTRGCIFCSAGGSGEFAAGPKYGISSIDIQAQLEEGRAQWKGTNTGNRFIAYFQAFTNTYGPVSFLETIYRQALEHPLVAGISIATRPDCMDSDVLNLLSALGTCYPDKFIWIELGLQTIHDSTAQYIRRGYPLSCFTDTLAQLNQRGFPVIVHIILGLPFETPSMILDTIHFLNDCSIQGVKLQLLHILKGTDLAADYKAGLFDTLSQDAYIHMLTDCITHLSPDIVIHRLTGDGSKDLLIAPVWSLNKRNVLNTIHHTMKKHSLRQGAML